MDNQHRKIVGYRELTQTEIDLMNEIKAKGKELLALHDQVIELIGTQDLAPRRIAAMEANARGGAYFIAPEPDADVVARHEIAEPRRWAAIAKTDLQKGIMALVRAVAQPTDC